MSSELEGNQDVTEENGSNYRLLAEFIEEAKGSSLLFV